jgi:hypothetical protein
MLLSPQQVYRVACKSGVSEVPAKAVKDIRTCRQHERTCVVDVCCTVWSQAITQSCAAQPMVPRPQVEACDCCEGFLMLQSMAGGTGAGVGTYLAEALTDEFNTAHMLNCCIW